MSKNNQIKNFQNLKVWQKSHKLVLEIYKITNLFPKEEIFGLTSQMRRCAASVTSNIAEGFNRKSYKEKNNFYHISLGSTVKGVFIFRLICPTISVPIGFIFLVSVLKIGPMLI